MLCKWYFWCDRHLVEASGFSKLVLLQSKGKRIERASSLFHSVAFKRSYKKLSKHHPSSLTLLRVHLVLSVHRLNHNPDIDIDIDINLVMTRPGSKPDASDRLTEPSTDHPARSPRPSN